jgi:type III pantothenate kinase
MKVIATGGLADVIARETDVIQIIAPWLTLDGLRIVWELNIGKVGGDQRQATRD